MPPKLLKCKNDYFIIFRREFDSIILGFYEYFEERNKDANV